MIRLTFILALVLSLSACATAPRKKANLAIDSESTPPPATSSPDRTSSETSEKEPTEGTIDLGFEGGSGPVKVEAVLSEEEQAAALGAQSGASSEKSEKKKKKKSDDDEESEEAEDPAEDSEATTEDGDDEAEEDYSVGADD